MTSPAVFFPFSERRGRAVRKKSSEPEGTGISIMQRTSLEGKDDEKIMDVDLIFKIAAIGIIVAVLNQVLIRSGREEQAMMTTLAGLIVVLMMIIVQINTLFETVKSVFGLY